MKTSAKNVQPVAATPRKVLDLVDADAPSETAVARFKMHLQEWGAPFSDMSDESVQEITGVLLGYWKLSRRLQPLEDIFVINQFPV